MAKPQVVDTRPLGADHSWARTNGTYIAGRAYIDGADETASEMEAKWGADRSEAPGARRAAGEVRPPALPHQPGDLAWRA
jgi:hypothetical protein